MKDVLKISDLDKEWRSKLNLEFEKDYFKSIEAFLYNRSKEVQIFPKFENCFRAFNETPFSKVKVVILGQDPYHGEGQAHGLSFSVPETVKIPPSLKNIFKELERSYEDFKFSNGNLLSWAKQGVFLLNSVLTVEKGNAASHKGIGWERFTDAVLKILSEKNESVVYLLWGSYAQKKAQIIDNKKHLILKAPHPSPLSAYRGFLGCDHFFKANEYLISKGKESIKWGLV